MATKYVFVTGGVVSGLGKGITAAALGRLLKARGLSVRNQKFDPYINVDPALMSPLQHGEIFVTEDGAETDLDVGHYERFTDINLTGESDITSGRVYLNVINRERSGGYNGGTVQVVPHIINEIQDHIYQVSEDNTVDVVISEIGGTVGDIEGLPFIEAIRQFSYEVGRENCLFIHVTLLPYVRTPGELKTKPTQHSVQRLLSSGIQPDILVCRTEYPLDEGVRRKLALYCNVRIDSVFENLDCESVYELPLRFEKAGFAKRICDRLNLPQAEPDLSDWKMIVDKAKAPRRKINIALVGKYTVMQDAYYSLTEALEHAGIQLGAEAVIDWIPSEDLENISPDEVDARLKEADGVLVPGGFGSRGMEGMIAASRSARERSIPFLGIGLGMQMGVVDIARELAGLIRAHSDESEKDDIQDVFYYADLSEEMIQNIDSIPFCDRPMRRGSYPMILDEGSILRSIYGKEQTAERHHHRREFNPAYAAAIASTGLRFSGMSPDGRLVEAIELPNHPFYVGLLAHPEFKSRPTRPHPVVLAFMKKAIEQKEIRLLQNKVDNRSE
ncbi:MAG: CTP synthase [Clostridiaceae bacterium]|nr:CTP synthase [Clostridiaceae bacterium]